MGLLHLLFWFVHSQPSKVLEDDVVIVVGVVGVLVTVTLDRLHLLERVDSLAIDGSGCRGQQLEGHVRLELPAEGSAVQLNPQRVRDDDTHRVRVALALADQRRRGQVDVLVLQVAVEGDSAAVLVARGQRYQEERLGEARAGRDRATLAGLQRGDVLAELGVDHGDLAVLDHEALDALDRLARVVRDHDVGGDLLAVVVDFPIQRHLQVDLALGEGEALADQRRGQATAALTYPLVGNYGYVSTRIWPW